MTPAFRRYRYFRLKSFFFLNCEKVVFCNVGFLSPVSLHRGQHATFAKSIQLMLVSLLFPLGIHSFSDAINLNNLISFHSRYASDGDEQPVLESMRDYLIGTIQKTFEVGSDQAEKLYQELLQCTRNKNLVSKDFPCIWTTLPMFALFIKFLLRVYLLDSNANLDFRQIL